MNTAIVRPLVDHLYDPDDVSMVYCLLVNRIQFLREQSYQVHQQTVNVTRASLCELLASRVLRRYDEDHPGHEGLLKVANVLVAGFEPFQNAPPEIVRNFRTKPSWTIRYRLARAEYARMLTALEVAIVSEAKVFLTTSACQKIVDSVYHGRIVYTPTSFMDILPDHYKNRGVSLYDPSRAPYLNQYRLIVPRNHNIIEVVQFVVLLALYVLMMSGRASIVGPRHLRFTAYEIGFIVYAVGWTLDEVASVLEHGWSVHTENLWSFLDITFVGIFWVYFSVRMHGAYYADPSYAKMASDVISLAAPVLLPRLAFCLMPESMLFIALRAMMADFMFLTILAAWCFGGFLLGTWPAHSRHFPRPPTDMSAHSSVVALGDAGRLPGAQPADHRQVDAVDLVRTGRHGGGAVGGAALDPGPRAHHRLCLSRQHPLPHHPARHAVQHLHQARRQRRRRDPIPPRRPHLRRRQKRQPLQLPPPPQRPRPHHHAPPQIPPQPPLVPQGLPPPPTQISSHPPLTLPPQVNVLLIRLHNAPLLILISSLERRFLWRSTTSKRAPWRALWRRLGASPHADLHAVFDAAPPQHVVDALEDLEDVLPPGPVGWEAGGGYGGWGAGSVDRRRGSRSLSQASGRRGLASPYMDQVFRERGRREGGGLGSAAEQREG